VLSVRAGFKYLSLQNGTLLITGPPGNLPPHVIRQYFGASHNVKIMIDRDLSSHIKALGHDVDLIAELKFTKLMLYEDANVADCGTAFAFRSLIVFQTL